MQPRLMRMFLNHLLHQQSSPSAEEKVGKIKPPKPIIKCDLFFLLCIHSVSISMTNQQIHAKKKAVTGVGTAFLKSTVKSGLHRW